MTPAAALRALHAAGRLASPHLPGMCWITADQRWRAYDPAGEPALDDPATAGGLFALLREATPGTRWQVGDWGDRWLCEPIAGPYGIVHLGATEGEAVAAALIAIAGGA